MQQYRSEADLVNDLLSHLRVSADITEAFAKEFNYHRGKADVICRNIDGKLVAFEAKLTRWRDALHQAYRNRCFANSSYVVLPKRTAEIAAPFEGEFRKRNVGLCYVDGTELVVIHRVTEEEPLQA